MALIVAYDPLSLTIASVGLSLVGGIAQGQAEQAQADDEAAFLEAEAAAEALALQDAEQDLDKERSRFLARSRAVFGAQGGDTTSGTALAVLQDQSSSFARQGHRLRRNSLLRQESLKARAANTRSAGRSASRLTLLRAAGAGLGAFTSFRLNSGPPSVPATTGTG